MILDCSTGELPISAAFMSQNDQGEEHVKAVCGPYRVKGCPVSWLMTEVQEGVPGEACGVSWALIVVPAGDRVDSSAVGHML